MVETIKIADLKFNEGQIEGLPVNPRTISDDMLGKLKRSLVDDPEMLECRPLIVYKSASGDNIVIAGNMRLKAAQELGFEYLPCHVLPEDTSKDKLRVITIKDNIGYGEWDWSKAAEEWDLKEFKSWGVDVPDE